MKTYHQNQYQNYNPSKPHCFLVGTREESVCLKLLEYSTIVVFNYDIELISRLQGKKVIISSALNKEGMDIADSLSNSLLAMMRDRMIKMPIQSLHLLRLGEQTILSLQKENALKSFLSNANSYECIYEYSSRSKPISEAMPKKQSKLEAQFERMKNEIPNLQILADFLGLRVIEN